MIDAATLVLLITALMTVVGITAGMNAGKHEEELRRKAEEEADKAKAASGS